MLAAHRRERAFSSRSPWSAGTSSGLVALLLAVAALCWAGHSFAYIPFTGVTAFAASSGGQHTCAVVGGAAKCWGDNSAAQIGDGTTNPALTPIQVSGLTSGVTSVAAGNVHSCALTSAGAVKCWGTNTNGQLGDNTQTNRLTPVAVSGLASGVAAIVAGAAHTCALTTGGAVKCWGKNSWGQLGDNTVTQRLTPVSVSGLASGVVAIAAGQFHTCAVTSAGLVKCWGNNTNGQLGDNSVTQRLTPVTVSGIASGATAVAAGNAHTCAVVSGGVKCWGLNANGQLGDGTQNQSLIPVSAVGLTSGIASVVAGHVAHVRTHHGLGGSVLGPQPGRRVGRWHPREPASHGRCSDGHGDRRLGDHGGQSAHVCARDRRRRELLGKRPSRPARRQRERTTIDAACHGRPARREGSRGRRIAYMRHRRQRRRPVLGRQRQRPARRQLDHAAVDARRRRRARQRHRRGGDRRDAHLRTDGSGRRQVLGRKLERAARRRLDHSAIDAGRRERAPWRREVRRRRRHPRLCAHDYRWRQVLGAQHDGPARRWHDHATHNARRCRRFDLRRPGDRSGSRPYVRADGFERGEVLGMERTRPAGRRYDDATADTRRRERTREWHCRDRRGPVSHVRAGGRRREVLGLERLWTTRRQLRHPAADAGGRQRPRDRRGRRHCRQQPHLRRDERRRSQVLGRQHVRTARRRQCSAAASHPRRRRRRRRRDGRRRRRFAHVRTHRERPRLLGTQQQRPARRQLGDAKAHAGRRHRPGRVCIRRRRRLALVRTDRRRWNPLLGKQRVQPIGRWHAGDRSRAGHPGRTHERRHARGAQHQSQLRRRRGNGQVLGRQFVWAGGRQHQHASTDTGRCRRPSQVRS